MKHFEVWIRNTERNIFYMFPTFERCPSSDTESKKNFFVNHLGVLKKAFTVF